MGRISEELTSSQVFSSPIPRRVPRLQNFFRSFFPPSYPRPITLLWRLPDLDSSLFTLPSFLSYSLSLESRFGPQELFFRGFQASTPPSRLFGYATLPLGCV